MINLPGKIKLKKIISAAFLFVFSYLAGINLAFPFFLLCLYLYLRARRLQKRNCNILNLTLLFLIIFAVSYFICARNLPYYYIPFSLIPMLAMLLFGNIEVALLLTLAAALPASGASRFPVQLMLMFMVSAILGAILVADSRKRITVIRAGFIVGIAQSVLWAFTFRLNRGFSSEGFYFLINGLSSSVIVLGVLPIFEYLFGAITNISLLELADFHHPLQELLIQEAPGTYHHSLIVGNLSESAARAIGANALLSRIGAYYHDIGKIKKPEYFSENQSRESNKHDQLAPTMSKLVIMNHVKEGVELAKKYKLNPLLIDFIEQHHGKSLVFYFYRRALESPEENQGVEEEGFRYPGPKPDSKETAIVLLADSVEAASKSLKDPTPDRIEELVHKIINNKFIDGQLDDCDLTLKDLEKISAVFTKLLCGIHHSRITYN